MQFEEKRKVNDENEQRNTDIRHTTICIMEYKKKRRERKKWKKYYRKQRLKISSIFNIILFIYFCWSWFCCCVAFFFSLLWLADHNFSSSTQVSHFLDLSCCGEWAVEPRFTAGAHRNNCPHAGLLDQGSNTCSCTGRFITRSASDIYCILHWKNSLSMSHQGKSSNFMSWIYEPNKFNKI